MKTYPEDSKFADEAKDFLIAQEYKLKHYHETR